MVHFVRLLTAAALVSVSTAAPMKARDSSYGGDSSSSDSSYSPPSDSGSYNSDNSYSAPPSQYTSGYDNSYSAPPSQYTSSASYDNSYPSNSYDNSNTNAYDNSDSSSSYDNSNTNSYDNSYTSSYDNSNTNTYDNSYSSSSSYDTNTYDNTYSTSSSDNSYNSYTTTSDDTSTMYESTMTTSSDYSSSTASYGSGSSNWGSGYNDCVMQCAASFGMPSGTWAPPTETASDSSMYGGETGSNGVTHTVIVAPTQGVLRYVPFSTNASVGDTVTFKWNAGPHTVTSSSALELCTKNPQGSLASGSQNSGFTYDYVVKDDKPTWFYCGVADHCKQGMFGGININQPNPDGSDYVPLSSVVQNMTSGNTDMSNMWHLAKQQTGDNAYANGWGMNINVGGMDSQSQGEIMKNVLYTQTVIAANPDAVDGTKGFQVGSNPLKMPGDITTLFANNSNNSSAPAASSSAPASAASSAAPAASSPSGKNGAASMVSSSAAVAFIAIAASFLML